MVILWFLWSFWLMVGSVMGELNNVRIGQLFEHSLSGDSVDVRTLPSWIRFAEDESLLFGIPRFENFENVTLITTNGAQLEINVRAEIEPCGQKDFVFVEKYDEKDMSSFGVEDLRQQIKDFADSLDIEASKIRAFTFEDLKKYRRVEMEVISLTADPRPSQLVLWTIIGCGDFYDHSENKVLGKVDDLNSEGRMIRAGQAKVLVENVLALQTATPASFLRTTRGIHGDQRPVLYNQIGEQICERGILCRRSFQYNTFTDEDGLLNKLNPTIESMGEHSNFLRITFDDHNNVGAEGVALENGKFGFRLGVRDHFGQASSAPFNVIVRDTPKANHLFEFQLEHPASHYAKNPSLLANFAINLADWFGVRPQTILIDSIEADPQNERYSIIRWSNSSLRRDVCEEKEINMTKSRMVKGIKDRVINDFNKKLGSDFFTRKITVYLRDSCDKTETPPPVIVNFRATTQRTTQEEEAEAGGLSSGLLIALVVAALVLLLAVFILCFFCLQRKRHTKKKAATDFPTKRHPVVFADEIQTDGVNGATATTPMLVPNEHPPSTTTTQNPLYKAPSESRTAQRLPPPFVAP